MKQEDFEAITAIDAVKAGRVRIELNYLGFEVTAVSRPTGLRTIGHIITYAEACAFQGRVVDLFSMVIDGMLRELNV